jgi:anti-sigma factor RsiW
MTDPTDFFREGHVTWLGLSALADGELMASEARALDEHLAACGACRRTYEDLLALSEALEVGRDEREPEVLPDRREAAVSAALEAFDDERRSVAKGPGPALVPARRAGAASRQWVGSVAVALVLVIGAVVGVLELGRGSSSSPSTNGSGRGAEAVRAENLPAPGLLGIFIAPLLRTGTCPLRPVPSAPIHAEVAHEIWSGADHCALVGGDQVRLQPKDVSEAVVGPGGKVLLQLRRPVSLPPIAVVLVDHRVVGRAVSGGRLIVIVRKLTPYGRALVERAVGH